MIKLISVEPMSDYRLRLRFSDGSSGVYAFTSVIERGTVMTEPLRDPAFFRRCFIELGALTWPNGLDFSAASLQLRLQELGQLDTGSAAA